MARSSLTPLGAVSRGLVAGAIGTAPHDRRSDRLLQGDRHRAKLHGKVAKRIIEGVLKREVAEERTNVLNQGIHWLYGTLMGLPYGLAAGSRWRPPPLLRSATAFGLAVWAAGRIELKAMQLAPPPWQDPPASLAIDVGFHQVYGLGAALAFRALNRIACS